MSDQISNGEAFEENVAARYQQLVDEGIEAKDQLDGARRESNRASRQQDDAKWRLGDLANEVETVYGEATLAKYASAIGVSSGDLENCRWVARAFEKSTRVENLYWSHHREVASRDDRYDWLRLAEEGTNGRRWTVDTLRTKVKQATESRLAINAPSELYEPKVSPKVREWWGNICTATAEDPFLTNTCNPYKTFFAVGGYDRSRVNMLKQLGAMHMLFSYAHMRKRRDFDLIGEVPNVLLDSGGYSEGFKKNNEDPITLEEYIEFLLVVLKKYRDNIVGYFVLDDMNDPGQTLYNQKIMEKAGLEPIPIFHMYEPPPLLDNYAKKYEFIGLGGIAIGGLPWWSLKPFTDYALARHRKTRFHVLGCASFLAFSDFQPYSIDSTSWVADMHGRLFILDEHGMPASVSLPKGGRFFLDVEAQRANNVRAMLEFEKMRWARED